MDPKKKTSFAMLQPGSKQGLTAAKVQSFTVGKQKKSRFQKDREAKEAREAAEKAEADALLEDFAASFEGDTGSSKAFVGSGGGIYQPPVKSVSEMDRIMLEMQRGGAGSSSSSSSELVRGRGAAEARAPSTLAEMAEAKNKKRREMDAFLEEIKRKQAAGPSDAANPAQQGMNGMNGGSMYGNNNSSSQMDQGDPSSTNLYIGHVAPTVTEERLQTMFGEFGEIYSIKIMWPRTDEERARKRNCGFVSFWRRGDAEAAKQALQNREIDGMQIQVGWGKAINKLAHGIGDETRVKDIPLHAVQDPSAADSKATADAITVLGPVKDGPPQIPANLPALLASAGLSTTAAASAAKAVAEAAFAAITAKRAADAAAAAGVNLQPLASDAPLPEMTDDDPQIEVIEPASEEVRHVINRTARFVAKDGAALETSLMQRERDNPLFAFLFDLGSEEGIYYRWRAISLVMGDREKSWSTKPFQLTPGGPFWIPPEPPAESDSEAEREAEYQRERERRRKEARDREAAAAAAAAEGKDPVKEERKKYKTGRQLEKARLAEREQGGGGGRLSAADAAAFAGVLAALTVPSRKLIREAMGMALDHSEASAHVVELITLSLLDTAALAAAAAAAAAPATDSASGDSPAAGASTAVTANSGTAAVLPPPPVMMTRMYVLSDVLHNSAAPVRNASSFRTLLQAALPRIFEGLGSALRGVGGRMTARQLQDRVLALLQVWSNWSIYPPLYMTGLEATFMRKASALDDTDAAAAAAAGTAAGADAAAVDESQLDRDNLERKSRQAGLFVEDSMSALVLLKRLNLLSAYVKDKAAGRGGDADPLHGDPMNDAAADVATVGSDASDYDSDLDGVPLPPAGAAAAAPAATTPRSSSNGSHSQGGGGSSSRRRSHAEHVALLSSSSNSGSDDDDIDGVPLPLPPRPPPPPIDTAAATARSDRKRPRSRRSRSRSSSSSSDSSRSRSRSPRKRKELPPPPPGQSAAASDDSSSAQAPKKSRWD